jgi:hypothetical protein
VTHSEFKEVLSKFLMAIPDDQMDELIRSFDEDGNGTIDFNEFVSRVLERDRDLSSTGAGTLIFGGQIDPHTIALEQRNRNLGLSSAIKVNHCQKNLLASPPPQVLPSYRTPPPTSAPPP